MSILVIANDYKSRTAFHSQIGGEAMKYLLMCCHEEKKWDSMSKSECDAVMEETIGYVEALKKSGQLLAVEQLDPVKTAISVRVRSGKLAVTDGPYAETKEQLGGFFLIDARDLNEAIQVASKFPSVRFGTMEVRPVRDLVGSDGPADAL